MAMSAFTSTAGIYPDGEKVRFVPDSDIGGEACSFTGVFPDGKKRPQRERED
jgi:hypothetical protein